MPSISDFLATPVVAPTRRINYASGSQLPDLDALAQTQFQTGKFPGAGVGDAGLVPINRIGPSRKPSAAQKAALAQIYGSSGTRDTRDKGYVTGNALYGSTYVDDRITAEQEELLNQLESEKQEAKTLEINNFNLADQMNADRFAQWNDMNRAKYPNGSGGGRSTGGYNPPAGTYVNNNALRLGQTYARGGQPQSGYRSSSSSGSGNRFGSSPGFGSSGGSTPLTNSVNDFFSQRFSGNNVKQPQFSFQNRTGQSVRFGQGKQSALRGQG